MDLLLFYSWLSLIVPLLLLWILALPSAAHFDTHKRIRNFIGIYAVITISLVSQQSWHLYKWTQDFESLPIGLTKGQVERVMGICTSQYNPVYHIFPRHPVSRPSNVWVYTSPLLREWRIDFDEDDRLMGKWKTCISGGDLVFRLQETICQPLVLLRGNSPRPSIGMNVPPRDSLRGFAD